MDVFDFHDGVIQDYARYVRSFVNIRDERIDEKVAAELSGGKLWPNPLVQFNPAYEEGESVDVLYYERLAGALDDWGFERDGHSGSVSTR